MDKNKLNDIISILDKYLIENQKDFISLKTANAILKKSYKINLENGELKKLLEKGKIKNSYQTQNSPKQWRITLSDENIKTNKLNQTVKVPKREVKNKNEFSEIKDFFKNNKTFIVITSLILVGIISVFFLSINQKNEIQNTSEINYDERNETNLNNKIFYYKSYENDKEYISTGQIIQTNNEETYHTFDFINKKVICKTKLNGKTIKFEYPINGFYLEKGISATTYVIEVNTLGVKEIWFSPDVPNLGYDYDDGTRISCYKLELINSE